LGWIRRVEPILRQSDALVISLPPFRVIAAGLAIALHLSAVLFGSGFGETSEFADVTAAVGAAVKQFGAAEVLLACDLDNTLLSMDQDLGSDQWFEWQSFLLSADPKSRYLVADDFPGLLEVQGLLFAALRSHPTQADLPRRIADIQRLGVATMIVTARGQEFRSATESELTRNGYDFSKTCPELREQPKATDVAATVQFVPYESEAITASGLTVDEQTRWHLLQQPREVSYGEGVYMVAGQHKGAMLAVFLHEATRTYKAVVYVDQGRQVRRVYEALAPRGYDVTAIDYQREDARVKAFNYGSKKAVDRQWRRLERAISVH
jgi:hypothetical protein